MMGKFYCLDCKANLTRIPEGEWVDTEGYIFCKVTEEIHKRDLKWKKQDQNYAEHEYIVELVPSEYQPEVDDLIKSQEESNGK